MSRPMVLVFLFLVLIITSQFEWKQQLVDDLDSSPNDSKKLQHSNREEVVKEKIILLQEKSIQRLNRLVQSLQQQLLQCQNISNLTDTSGGSLITSFNEVVGHRTLED